MYIRNRFKSGNAGEVLRRNFTACRSRCETFLSENNFFDWVEMCL